MSDQITVAEYARALSRLPLLYAELPLDEIKIAIFGRSLIVAHPNRQPMRYVADSWCTLTIAPKYA